jgi:hypothetical protein
MKQISTVICFTTACNRFVVNPDLEDTIIKAGSWSNVQCCRSAVMRIRIQLITLIRMRILLEADPDPNIHRGSGSGSGSEYSP